MLVPSCFEGKTRPGYATETTCGTVSQKRLAHCVLRLVSTRIAVPSQIVIKLVENHADWRVLIVEIYNNNKRTKCILHLSIC